MFDWSETTKDILERLAKPIWVVPVEMLREKGEKA